MFSTRDISSSFRYGSRAAEIARARARIAANVDDEQAWFDIAEAIARDR